ncbi:MAG: response regulator transcription factor [Pirellulales bacterium]|nr:response regulator transcription factor [Pirellulales bacterium]
MDDIQVVLAVDSPMLREALREMIGREPTLAVAGDAVDPVDLLVTVRRTEAQVVILTWPETEVAPSVCSHLLLEFPELLVIGISATSDRVVACRQTITVSELPVAGLRDLLSEICHTAIGAEEIHA